MVTNRPVASRLFRKLRESLRIRARGFVTYAKANEATMRYGSAGAASGPHLACALLNASIAVDVTHVPYRGGAQALQDLIAGRIDYQCTLVTNAIAAVQGDLIKPIAILAKERSAILPQILSAHEQGLANVEAVDWLAFFLPKRTPAEIVRKLHLASSAALDIPTVAQRLNDIGANIVARERRSPEYLERFVESETRKWASVIKSANIHVD
jgi:tripartite-type tricarboxylate transporter receptor subunit TctC